MNVKFSISTLSLGLDIDDPYLVVHFLELDMAKSLCQDVGLLLTSPGELHDHCTFLDAVMYEVIADIDVFLAIFHMHNS